MSRGFFVKPSIAQQLCECHIRKRLALFGSLEDELTARGRVLELRGVSPSSAALSGTTWAFRDFIRCLGMTQIAFSRSNSDQSASRVSLLRVAVRIRNSNANLVLGQPRCGDR